MKPITMIKEKLIIYAEVNKTKQFCNDNAGQHLKRLGRNEGRKRIKKFEPF
jgi:hypothetical protein